MRASGQSCRGVRLVCQVGLGPGGRVRKERGCMSASEFRQRLMDCEDARAVYEVGMKAIDKLEAFELQVDALRTLLRRSRDEIRNGVPISIRDCELYDAINAAIGELAQDTDKRKGVCHDAYPTSSFGGYLCSLEKGHAGHHESNGIRWDRISGLRV